MLIDVRPVLNPEVIKAKFLDALGLERDYPGPTWPLPNLRRSSEAAFWGWRSSYSFQIEAHVTSIKIPGLLPQEADTWCNLFLFFYSQGHLAPGGFAVLHPFNASYKKLPTFYYEWGKCHHDFKQKNIGNCLNRYTCSKCSHFYDVDSSD